MFCQYKDIFGKPNKGIHKYRLFGLAIVDMIATVVGAYIIYISTTYKYSFYQILFILVILGIISHKLFCVDTALNKMLFD
jgi:hypothetical protein